MPPKIFTCQNCGTKNRVPSERIGQKATCGSCGKVIVGTDGKSDACPVCQNIANNGVHLSSGKTVHEACLKKLQTNREETESEIREKQSEIRRIRSAIEKHNGFAFKLKSLFSNPQVELDELSFSVSRLQYDIDNLSSHLFKTRTKLSSIYDYFLSYPPDWDERRQLLIDAKGSACSNCGTASHLHVHHVKPLSKGGGNELSNLIMLCENCHSEAHGGRDFSGEFKSSETAFSKRVSDIRYAINNGKRIQFSYKKPTDKSYKQRTIRPAKLENVDHHRDTSATLCVRGYCELRKAERIFALKRMRGLRLI